MASVRVEGILGHVLVSVEWRDGEISGSPVLLKGIEQAARRESGRYDDPLAFAALASRVVERFSDEPARVITEGIVEEIGRGMAGLANSGPSR